MFKNGATIINEVENVFTSLTIKLEKGINLETVARGNKQSKVDKLDDEMREHDINIAKANRIKTRIEAITKD